MTLPNWSMNYFSSWHSCQTWHEAVSSICSLPNAYLEKKDIYYGIRKKKSTIYLNMAKVSWKLTFRMRGVPKIVIARGSRTWCRVSQADGTYLIHMCLCICTLEQVEPHLPVHLHCTCVICVCTLWPSGDVPCNLGGSCFLPWIKHLPLP